VVQIVPQNVDDCEVKGSQISARVGGIRINEFRHFRQTTLIDNVFKLGGVAVYSSKPSAALFFRHYPRGPSRVIAFVHEDS